MWDPVRRKASFHRDRQKRKGRASWTRRNARYRSQSAGWVHLRQLLGEGRCWNHEASHERIHNWVIGCVCSRTCYGLTSFIYKSILSLFLLVKLVHLRIIRLEWILPHFSIIFTSEGSTWLDFTVFLLLPDNQLQFTLNELIFSR